MKIIITKKTHKKKIKKIKKTVTKQSKKTKRQTQTQSQSQKQIKRKQKKMSQKGGNSNIEDCERLAQVIEIAFTKYKNLNIDIECNVDEDKYTYPVSDRSPYVSFIIYKKGTYSTTKDEICFESIIYPYNINSLSRLPIIQIGTSCSIYVKPCNSLSVSTILKELRPILNEFNITNLEVEKSFHNNVKNTGMSECIKAVKGDSVEVLMNMVKTNDKYDFVYVDGSHLALDCFADLILSWELLNKGGIMGIDDYLYNYEPNNRNFDSPNESVNRFLKKYEGKYKILHMQCRVFLEKL
jgi:hypothetical protein